MFVSLVSGAPPKDETRGEDPTQSKIFLHFLIGTWIGPRKKRVVSLLFQILSQICPRLTSHIKNGVREGAFTYLIWGLVMGPAYPLNRKLVSELPLDEEHDTDEGTSDSIMSLLEENARLRGLVVKLTDLILKNVADRG